MSMDIKTFASVVGFCFLFAGCSQSGGQFASNSTELPQDTAVLLIGIEGTRALNRVRMCAFSCLNFQFSGVKDDVIALAINVPRTGLRFVSFTTTDRPDGYTSAPVGNSTLNYTSSYGYRAVDSSKIDLPHAGVCYYGILNVDSGAFNEAAPQKQIDRAYQKFPTLLAGQPRRNF